MLTGMDCALNYHVVAVVLPYKNVGNLLSQFAVADFARFHTVSEKKLHFVKQVAVPEQKKPPVATTLCRKKSNCYNPIARVNKIFVVAKSKPKQIATRLLQSVFAKT